MKYGLEKGTIIIFIFSMLTNGINYIFQILAGKTLTVQEFGILNTILSIILILNVMSNTIKMVIAKYINDELIENKGKRLNIIYSKSLHYITSMAIIFCIISSLFLYIVKFFWELKKRVFCIIIIVILITFISFFQYAVMGVAQGLQLFITMSLIGTSLAIVKVNSIILINLFHRENIKRLNLILIFILVGIIISTIIGMFFLRKSNYQIKLIKIKKIVSINNEISIKFPKSIFLGNLLIMVMMNMTLLFIRYYFSNYISGIYSSAMLFGRILEYAITSIIGAMYPTVIKKRAKREKTIVIYRKSFIYTILCSLIFTIIILLGGEKIIILLFGKKYEDCIPLIKYCCITSLMVGFNILNINYLMALNKTKIFFLISILLILFVFIGEFFKKGIEIFLISLSVYLFLIFIISLIYIIVNNTKEGERFERG